jgi:hypothetical protein
MNKELYDRIIKIKNLINYHASRKITDYNMNLSINNINNINYINNRIEIKRKYKHICLLNEKINSINNNLFTHNELLNIANIITQMENLLLDIENYCDDIF